MGKAVLITVATAAVLLGAKPVLGERLPAWTKEIRSDHPRLFFNDETWPAVRARAIGPEAAWYKRFKSRIDGLESGSDPKDLGPEAAWSAFVFLVTEEAKYLDIAKRCLETSIRYYEQCFAQRKTVNWYSTSRVHAIVAWDWLFDHLASETAQLACDTAVDPGIAYDVRMSQERDA